MSVFSERFSEQKKLKGVSFDAMSRELGISVRALKYYASGENEPTVTNLLLLTDYFEVSADYLIGRSDNANRN